VYVHGGSILTWILLPGGGGSYCRLLGHPDSTIEKELPPTIYEDIMVDFEFEVLTAVTMKSAVFWFVAPCSSEKPQRFRGTACLLLLLVSYLA
jgi:hypothetical protein